MLLGNPTDSFVDIESVSTTPTEDGLTEEPSLLVCNHWTLLIALCGTLFDRESSFPLSISTVF